MELAWLQELLKRLQDRHVECAQAVAKKAAVDASGLTFQEWDRSAGTDDTSAPVATLVNSNELCAADFPLAEVRPLQLDVVTRGGRRRCGSKKASGCG